MADKFFYLMKGHPERPVMMNDLRFDGAGSEIAASLTAAGYVALHTAIGATEGPFEGSYLFVGVCNYEGTATLKFGCDVLRFLFYCIY